MAMNQDDKSSGQDACPAHEFVQVDIGFGEHGMPQAPATVHVHSGGTLGWRTAPGVDAPFRIVAKTAWVEDDPPGLQSELVEGRHQVCRRVTNVPGTYEYGIWANGHFLDPTIIVRP